MNLNKCLESAINLTDDDSGMITSLFDELKGGDLDDAGAATEAVGKLLKQIEDEIIDITSVIDEQHPDIRKAAGDTFDEASAKESWNNAVEYQGSMTAVPFVKSGDINKVKSGKPLRINYAHNKESATKLFGKAKKDSEYGRWYEPAGKFVTHIDSLSNSKSGTKNMEYGELTFNNPLVLDNDGLKWKKTLSNKYGGKRGKKLSQAVIDDGYDAIITIDGAHTSEIVDLTSFDKTHRVKK